MVRFHTPEGATPIDDASGLIPEGILTYADLNSAEAENILKAMDLHLKRRRSPMKSWLTEEYIRKVHRDMFKDVWEWAGTYRKSGTNLGVPVHSIYEEIAKLCQDLAYWTDSKNTMAVIERAVRIHHRLSYIHPFQNGNGRLARMISDIYLHSHHHPLPLWPESNLLDDGKIRKDYLHAIREADKGHFKLILNFTRNLLR